MLPRPLPPALDPQMNGWGRPEIDAEVAGGRQALVDSCGIPGEHVVGWRAPFLQSSAASREVSGRRQAAVGACRCQPGK